MGHQQLYHPSGRIELSNLRSLLVLVILRQVSGAPFSSKSRLSLAVYNCLHEVPSGNECCSSGIADCMDAGTDDMSDWDVSKIRNMAGLFDQTLTIDSRQFFNQDISRWNVSQVESMDNMFQRASLFDADITSWDTSSLLSSYNMFAGATAWINKYERKDGKGLGMKAADGPPSAWRRKDLPPLPPSSPHLESPPHPAQAVTSPPPPPESVPEVSPPPAPAYDPPTTSVGVGTVILIAFIMLVVGFMSGYVVRLWRSKKGVPILDEDPDEETFERAQLSST